MWVDLAQSVTRRSDVNTAFGANAIRQNTRSQSGGVDFSSRWAITQAVPAMKSHSLGVFCAVQGDLRLGFRQPRRRSSRTFFPVFLFQSF